MTRLWLLLRLLFFLPLLACATPPAASSPSRDELIAEHLELTGLAAQLEHQREFTRRTAADALPDTFAQFESQFPEASIVFSGVIEQEATRMLDSIYESWTPKEATDMLIDLYYSEFSDEELAGMLEYARSPLGSKDRIIGGKAMQELGEWISKTTTEASTQANREFFLRLQPYLESLRRQP